ncbi:soluble scavenger receptor cysteine-rich domain-containing protein SSC5D-like [Halichondria panicea]|uniref:soluble scavenger receptor cysteine-rich domain-containing protein SSC5D-like n=1 Tax=Halichondria panicea TaxID=6063 RepID=UPI00312B9679
MRLLFQISVLLLTLQRGTSTDSCLPEDHRKIRLTGPRSIKNEGAVQLCVLTENGYLWFYIQTQDGWTNDFTAANLACRELGLNYTGVRANTVWLMRNADTATGTINCNDGDEDLRDCLPDVLSVRGRSQVAGLICNCIEGALRLVDGSSYNEGRVEVCSNGRWGTVCGDGWTEREAALVCSRLGYPQEHATLSNFGEGSGPLYDITCPSTGSEDQECIPMIRSAPSSCTHSMDVGVRCLPFTDACAVPINEVTVTTTAQQPPTPTPPSSTLTIAKSTTTSIEGDVSEVTTNDKQPSTSTKTSQPSDGITTNSSITQSTAMSTSVTLGALIGLLAASLVVVVTGWIVSCVYLQRKINKGHTHSTPVSSNNHTLQHTPQDEALYDTINATVTNLEHNDTVQCVQNESYSLVGQRKMDK